MNNLQRLLLLGTDRTDPGPELRPLLERYGLNEDLPLTEVVLNALTVEQQLYKAARPLPRFQHAPDFPAAEQLPECPTQPLRHLLKIQQEDILKPLLSDFIFLTEKYEYLLPPHLLPEAFAICKAGSPLHRAIRNSMGERGHWLARQHSEWRLLFLSFSEKEYTTATPAERLAMLRDLRAQDPERAVATLLEDWPAERYQDKLAFLAVLATELHASDEVLLEEARHDKRKPVRQMAAKLLAKLPDSNYRHELEAAADDFFTKNKKEELALLPPSFWAEQWDCQIPQVIERFNTAGQGQLTALTEAASLHREASAMQALLLLWLDENRKDWDKPHGKQLLSRLPGAVFNAVCTRYLETHTYGLEPGGLMNKLLREQPHPWSDRLVKLISMQLQRFMHDHRKMEWEYAHYQHYLQRIALLGTPEFEGMIKTFLRPGPSASKEWDETIFKLFSTLKFRKSMANSFVISQKR